MSGKEVGGVAAGAALLAGGLALRSADDVAMGVGRAVSQSESVVAQSFSHADDFAPMVAAGSADDAFRSAYGSGASTRTFYVGRVASQAGHLSSKKQDVLGGEIVRAASNEIRHDFVSLPGPMTEARASAIFKANLSQSADKLSKAYPEVVKFELGSGKLTIKKEHRLGPVAVSYGEVNVYKVAATGAGAAILCYKLSEKRFQSCVDSAVDGAERKIAGVLPPTGKKLEVVPVRNAF